MNVCFSSDLSFKGEPLPHFWEHCVGSGHALLALRADWQAQLKQCRLDLGFQHVRFHAILCDDVGTLVEEKKKGVYSFHNCDQIYDFIRSVGMRPVVELSFMPSVLASGDQTVFHYNANVTPPTDYAKWATLISKLATHWIERYGANEVSLWPMEVWNEPNMKHFWTGTQEDYFKLFDYTHKALKKVHSGLKVGGPVTAQNAWIDDFIRHCETENTVPDFVSTHTYPTDAFGSPDDDTATQLSKSHLGILQERAIKVRESVGNKPLFYTEWCTSSDPRDERHDEPYAAAFIMHANLSMGALVDAYSYWTFSDIFEENYFSSGPFHGGFGLMNIQGIPKPSYRAYEMLRHLGEERLPVTGAHETVSVWVTRGKTFATVIVVNLALPKHSIKTEIVRLTIDNVPDVASVRMRRIDEDHANAKKMWKVQGEPFYPTPDQVTQMNDASRLQWEGVEWESSHGKLSFEVSVQAQSVTAIELCFKDAHQRAHEVEANLSVSFSDADEKLLDNLQSSAFAYFTKTINPANGLAPDSSKKDAFCSVAATGFALSCYPIAVERGWLMREEAASITLKTLQFFADSRQSADTDATGYKGFYYHFLDMKTGKRASKCELSTIDTAMLLAGAVVAEAYFDADSATEKQIRSLTAILFERVNWRWVLDDKDEIQEAWKPESGFKRAYWEGYTEALTLYVLGAASKKYPLPEKIYRKVTAQYKWRHNGGMEWLYAGPLFIHLFPQAWMDLRGLDDGIIGSRGIDYFENSRRAIAIQRSYAALNPLGFPGYDGDVWGLSACNGPSGTQESIDGECLNYLGYAARGVPAGPDDGTLVPWAGATCLAHSPQEALSGIRGILTAYPHALRDGCFRGALNPSLPGESFECWVSPDCFGLDQGLVVMMIENARSGMIWDITRKSAIFKRGLTALGFHGGWLE